MQKIAAEMNLSETAYVTPLEENSFSLGKQNVIIEQKYQNAIFFNVIFIDVFE